MDQRQYNEPTSTADKVQRPSTLGKYPSKGTDPFKPENVYYDPTNKEHMIRTQHGVPRKLTTRQFQQYKKIKQNKDKNAEQIRRRNLLGIVNPSFDPTFKKQEINKVNNGVKKEISKQKDEYGVRQDDYLLRNEAQTNQSPKLKKKSSKERLNETDAARKNLADFVQKNLDSKFKSLQQRLKSMQEARKSDRIQIIKKQKQNEQLKASFQALTARLSDENMKQYKRLDSLITTLSNVCKEQFKQIKMKLSSAIEGNTAKNVASIDATVMERRRQNKDYSLQQQRGETGIKRQLEKIKFELKEKQQSQREIRKKYQQLQTKITSIIDEKKFIEDKCRQLQKKYNESIQQKQSFPSKIVYSNKILFFSPTILQKQIQNFLLQSIQKITNKRISSTKLLYQLDEFNLSIANYLTRPPFPVLLLLTSEQNNTFAIFSQGIESNKSKVMRNEQIISSDFKTALLNCEAQTILEKNPKSPLKCGAIFMQNQLIIGSNELVIKNNNLRTLKVNSNSFVEQRYFNIKRRLHLIAENQENIAIKTLEIHELFLI